MDVWHQAISSTNAGQSGPWSVDPLGTNFNEIWIKAQQLSYKKVNLKMLSATGRSFCVSLNVLTLTQRFWQCHMVSTVQGHGPHCWRSKCVRDSETCSQYTWPVTIQSWSVDDTVFTLNTHVHMVFFLLYTYFLLSIFFYMEFNMIDSLVTGDTIWYHTTRSTLTRW